MKLVDLTQHDPATSTGRAITLNPDQVLWCRQTPSETSTTEIFLPGDQMLIVMGSLEEVSNLLSGLPTPGPQHVGLSGVPLEF